MLGSSSIKSILVTVFLTTLLASCASTKNSQKTKNPFNAITLKKVLQKGKTTQKEVLENFGAPNITTNDSSGGDLWVYSQKSSESGGGSVGVGILGSLGIPSLGYLDGTIDKSSVSSKSINISMTFNKSKVLESFKVVRTAF